MSCPTCDHTMDCIGEIKGVGFFVYHCPRCGTVKKIAEDIGDDEVYTPKLVERCRRFEHGIIGDPLELDDWKLTGIAESINKPEKRP